MCRLLPIRQECDYPLSFNTAKPSKYNYKNLCSLECKKISHKINIVFILFPLVVIKMHQWFLNYAFLWLFFDWLNFCFAFLLVYKVFHILRITHYSRHNRLLSVLLDNKSSLNQLLKNYLLLKKVGKARTSLQLFYIILIPLTPSPLKSVLY